MYSIQAMADLARNAIEKEERLQHRLTLEDKDFIVDLVNVWLCTTIIIEWFLLLKYFTNLQTFLFNKYFFVLGCACIWDCQPTSSAQSEGNDWKSLFYCCSTYKSLQTGNHVMSSTECYKKWFKQRKLSR